MKRVVEGLQAVMQVVPDADDFTLPRHWVSKGLSVRSLPKLVPLAPTDDDYCLVQARLQAVMPTATIESIELNCNVGQYRMFFQQRQLVARSNGWDGEDGMELRRCSNERWCWHGLEGAALESVMREGFRVQHSSLEFACYGSGLYFAPDARLAHWFAAGRKKQSRGKLILARVACGKVWSKPSLLDPQVHGGTRWLAPGRGNEWDTQLVWQLLRSPDHRNAPEGYQSVTGVDSRGARGREDKTEVVWHPPTMLRAWKAEGGCFDCDSVMLRRWGRDDR